MENKKDILYYLRNLDLIVTGLSVVALIILTFANVICRYVINSPITWCEEVQLWLFVWITFLGAGAAFRSKSHVCIEFLVDRLPHAGQRAVEIINYAVVVGLLIFVTWASGLIVQQMEMMGRVTNILHIPFTLIYAAVPIGCVIMILSFTVTFIERMRYFPVSHEALEKETEGEG
ncbi:hypothetical protein TAMA11512_04930 [Selenomonas sp. TAMA-11512]|uniref:TRAP transporter small permease n=1 Tax=Selenomonas sp. TAMA-11512 TaxID=3095337 RepID=UPI0030852CC6|nr:hypothetical protein TAMA11512_04930 [Selenomonas sp. TAMA-11512]